MSAETVPASCRAPLAVFAYAFPHRKTQDFLIELVAAGYRDLTVIGAPMTALNNIDRMRYFRTSLRRPSALDTGALCRALGVTYFEAGHDDFETIADLARWSGARMAVISGARILKRGAIACFPDGVLNLHPGKLPQTAGLDAFYYSILRSVPLGVTAHFIDHRIDAGHELFFEETALNPADTPDIILENNYQTQIVALRRFLALLSEGQLQTVPINRPSKNNPMSPDSKREMLQCLPEWLAEQYMSQQAHSLIKAIESNDTDTVDAILKLHPTLVHHRTPQGWTALIVACHHQRDVIVSMLLAHGADPNFGGKNGTTPLMYAKTALIGQSEANYSLLETLLIAGARIGQCDAAGRDILYYAERLGDLQMAQWLKARKDN